MSDQARPVKVRLSPGQSVQLCDIEGCVEIISVETDPDPATFEDGATSDSLPRVPLRSEDVLPPNTTTPMWVSDNDGNRSLVLVRGSNPSASALESLQLDERFADFVSRHDVDVVEPLNEEDAFQAVNAARDAGTVEVYAAGPVVSVGAVETLRVGAENAGLDFYLNVLS